jgi:NAD(P)H-dependent flavin oxidoreductase YrpB (nitropropane dioxygenase family)
VTGSNDEQTGFKVIQGGMGVGVSNWQLAHAVASAGQLGVVSGTGLAVVLARRLQTGDPGGHMRRALAAFPRPDIAARVLARYFDADHGDKPFKATPLPQAELPRDLTDLTVAANFAEVFLAKEGHTGPVGINYLEKIQTPTLASLYGAVLAGVDYVLMGAGIPRLIPGALDALSAGKPAELRLDVEGALEGEEFLSRFDPAAFMGGTAPVLRRPRFLAIVSSATLAMTLARKSNGRVDGFVVEGSTAGGHNAPPRGPLQLTSKGEPVYGPRDDADLTKIRELGLPFYLAGGYGAPGRLAAALAAGASGVQVGTAFAFCDESGIDPDLKARVIALALKGDAAVFTDPLASPTGFPFKVVPLSGTLADPAVESARTRVCDLGYLRKLVRADDGSITYRCAAEPETAFVAKGGDPADTKGRKCLCNALFATIGLAQSHPDGSTEPPIVTAGDDVAHLVRYLPDGATHYSATDVLTLLLAHPR